MWTKWLKSSFILGLVIIGVRAFAATEVTLPQLRQEALSSNYDVQIQYERYYQAQRNISVARGEFLPGISIQLVNVNATFAILQSVVPTPSDWFKYQGSKELAMAEKYTTLGIKLNILQGLTSNYITLKYYEMLLASMREQEKLLKEVYDSNLAQNTMGADNANDLYLSQRQLLQQQQDIYALETLNIIERQAMLIALGKNSSEELILGDLPQDDFQSLPDTKEEASVIALRNSNELISNTYQYQAAQFMVSAARWSLVSFSGIGFDYAARVSIEKSKAKVIKLQGEQLSLKIQNQIYSLYRQISVLDQRLALQESILASTQETQARQEDLFSNRLISLSTLNDSKINTISEQRTLTKLQLEREVKIVELKRLLSLDTAVGSSDFPRADEFTINSRLSRTRFGSKLVVLSLDAPNDALSNVYSVTYSVDGMNSPYRVLKSDNGFQYMFSAKNAGTYNVNVVILSLLGETIELSTTVVVQ
ncbi:MAG: hypothetical protein K2P81_06845 [Bacteriovoracaceae bacterium]|nr:hypothetical protein [Bacteriovoracaceae bacterium]